LNASQSASAQATQADDAFEEVRQSFLERLRGEHARLVKLTLALGSAERDATAAFGDLEKFAHRLRGAAAVFEERALSEAAKDLELAVSAASIARTRHDDALVRMTLHTLAERLAVMNAPQEHGVRRPPGEST